MKKLNDAIKESLLDDEDVLMKDTGFTSEFVEDYLKNTYNAKIAPGTIKINKNNTIDVNKSIRITLKEQMDKNIKFNKVSGKFFLEVDLDGYYGDLDLNWLPNKCEGLNINVLCDGITSIDLSRTLSNCDSIEISEYHKTLENITFNRNTKTFKIKLDNSNGLKNLKLPKQTPEKLSLPYKYVKNIFKEKFKWGYFDLEVGYEW